WDPVENAGLMPWLTATALLHGLVMQRERAGFRGWNLILAVLSFSLVLFGTFVTRSGWIQSLHAFAHSSLGPYLLATIGLSLLGPLVLMIRRRSILLAPQPLARPVDRLLSRGGTFLLTLIILLTISASVFIGSVMPVLARLDASPAWFDRVTGPQFGLLLLLMGVCPLLGRAAQTLQRLRRRALLGALLGAGIVLAGAMLAGFTNPLSWVGFALIGLAGTTTAMAYVMDAWLRSQRLDEDFWIALWRLFVCNRRKYGGYLVHTGVILMALGVVGTRMYALETEAVFFQGESARVAGYTLTYEGFDQVYLGDRLTSEAAFSIWRGERFLTTLRPQVDQYANYRDQMVSAPALHVNLREDLYLVLAGWRDEGEMVTLKIFVNPLAVFLWVGALLFLGGGVAALWPVARPAHLSALEIRRRRARTFVGAGVGGVVLIAVALMLWGIGAAAGRSQARLAGRLRSGLEAPTFSLEQLDGSPLALADLRGKIVVVNFWATWCAPCEDELPDFQAVWEAYHEQGVTFVGLAVQRELDDVRAMTTRFGVGYPVGLDRTGEIAESYGISGVPETFVVDAEGRIVYVHVGPMDAEALQVVLDGMLEEE
ncbi:MAG TPA: redoxin domain-containing protein, partial [Chloroflexi bacterium]|nr:redoxin domain-containing protein [Chloroflexota bacterium]